jgi:hypothetical protein
MTTRSSWRRLKTTSLCDHVQQTWQTKHDIGRRFHGPKVGPPWWSYGGIQMSGPVGSWTLNRRPCYDDLLVMALSTFSHTPSALYVLPFSQFTCCADLRGDSVNRPATIGPLRFTRNLPAARTCEVTLLIAPRPSALYVLLAICLLRGPARWLCYSPRDHWPSTFYSQFGCCSDLRGDSVNRPATGKTLLIAPRPVMLLSRVWNWPKLRRNTQCSLNNSEVLQASVFPHVLYFAALLSATRCLLNCFLRILAP